MTMNVKWLKTRRNELLNQFEIFLNFTNVRRTQLNHSDWLVQLVDPAIQSRQEKLMTGNDDDDYQQQAVAAMTNDSLLSPSQIKCQDKATRSAAYVNNLIKKGRSAQKRFFQFGGNLIPVQVLPVCLLSCRHLALYRRELELEWMRKSEPLITEHSSSSQSKCLRNLDSDSERERRVYI